MLVQPPSRLRTVRLNLCQKRSLKQPFLLVRRRQLLTNLPGGWDRIPAELPPAGTHAQQDSNLPAGTRAEAEDGLRDVWENRPYMIVRIHNVLRRALFDITDCDDPAPVPLNHI